METLKSSAQKALVALVTLLLPLTANAQEDDLNVELDANIGIENMEEPDASNKLENNTYLALSVAALLQAWNLQAYIQAPLRFNFDGFSIREADWDETEEILRAFRCVRLDYMSSGGYETRISETGECHSWRRVHCAGGVPLPVGANAPRQRVFAGLRLIGSGLLCDARRRPLPRGHFARSEHQPPLRYQRCAL